MTPSPLTFPPPRTAAGWLAGLAPRESLVIAAGYVTLLRVEVLIETRIARPLDCLTRSVLQAILAVESPTTAGVNRLLQIGEERATAALDAARRLGLVSRTASDHAVTDLGKQALAAGLPAGVSRRVRLAFRDGAFVPWPDSGPLTAHDSTTASGQLCGVGLVEAVFARDNDWKRDAGFPDAGERLVRSDDWRAVPIEAEQMVAVVLTRTVSGRVAGYTVEQPAWSLASAPAFEMHGEPAGQAFPELADGPRQEDLRSAWTGWAKGRLVPPDDLPASRLKSDGNRLVVAVPDRLASWLRQHREDVFSGQTWVWVGDGPLRWPAVLDVRPGG